MARSFLLSLVAISLFAVTLSSAAASRPHHNPSSSAATITSSSSSDARRRRLYPQQSARALLKEAGFSEKDIEAVLGKKGEIRTHILRPSHDREIGMSFAVLVREPPEGIKDTFLSMRLKKKCDADVIDMHPITVKGGGSSDGDDDSITSYLPDFEGLVLEGHLGEALAHDLARASPGDHLNLSRQEMEALNEVNNKQQPQPDDLPPLLVRRVEKRLREMLAQRFQSYRKKGLILPYARGHHGVDDYNARKDLEQATSSKLWESHILQAAAPAFLRHLNNFPQNRPVVGLEETYAWVTCIVQGKLSAELYHRMGYCTTNNIKRTPQRRRKRRKQARAQQRQQSKAPDEEGDDGDDEDDDESSCSMYVFSERQFYVLHGYNCMQSIGCAIPVEQGTLVIISTRTSCDGVAGFGGSAKKAIGARMMASMRSAILQKYRKESERGPTTTE